MNTKYNASLRSTLALGALLLLTAGLTGCGVGLPTSPDIQSNEAGIQSNGRTAGAMRGEFTPNGEVADSDVAPGGGAGSGEIQPAGEIAIQTPGHYTDFKGNGNAFGHLKNKWR